MGYTQGVDLDNFGGQGSLQAATGYRWDQFSPNVISTDSGRVSLTIQYTQHLLVVKDYFGPGQDFQMDILGGMLQGRGARKWRFYRQEGNFEYYEGDNERNVVFRSRENWGHLEEIGNSGEKGARIILNDEGWMQIYSYPSNHMIWMTGPTYFTSSKGLNYGRSAPLYSPDLNFRLRLVYGIMNNDSNTPFPNLVISKKNQNGQYDPIWSSNNVIGGDGLQFRYRINDQNKLTIIDRNFRELWSNDNIPNNIYIKYFLQNDGNLVATNRDIYQVHWASGTDNISPPTSIDSTITYYWQNYKIDRFIITTDNGSIWEYLFNKGKSPAVLIGDDVTTPIQRKDLGNNWLHLAPQLQDGSFLLIGKDYHIYKAPPGTTIRYVEDIGKAKKMDTTEMDVLYISQMVNKRFVAIDTGYNVYISDGIDPKTMKFKIYPAAKKICSIQQLLDSRWLIGIIMNDNNRYTVFVNVPSIFPPTTVYHRYLDNERPVASYTKCYFTTEAINYVGLTITRKFIQINSDKNKVDTSTDLRIINISDKAITPVSAPFIAITSSFNTGGCTGIIPIYNGYLLNYIFYNKYNVSDSLANPFSNYLYNPLSIAKLPISHIQYMLSNKESVYKTNGIEIPFESDGISPYLWWSSNNNKWQTVVDNLDYPVTLDIFKKLWAKKLLFADFQGNQVQLNPDYKYMAVTMADSTDRLAGLSQLRDYDVYYMFGRVLPSDDNLYQGKGGTYGGNVNNTTLFKVGRKPDSKVASVKNVGDDWPGTTWKIYDLSNNLNLN